MFYMYVHSHSSKLLQKSQFKILVTSQMTFREISCINRKSPLIDFIMYFTCIEFALINQEYYINLYFYFVFNIFKKSTVNGGTIQVSVAPGSCSKDQTPNNLPVSAAGQVVGHRLELTLHTDGRFSNPYYNQATANLAFYSNETSKD